MIGHASVKNKEGGDPAVQVEQAPTEERSLRLEDLAGAGPGIAAALRRAFPDERRFWTALEDGDLATLCQVPGVSTRRAAQWVHHVRGTALDDRFCGTPDVTALMDRLLDRIASYAVTREGRDQVRLLRPLANQAEAEAKAHEVLAHRDEVAGLDPDAVAAALKGLHRLRTPRPVRRTGPTVVVFDPETRHRLEEAGVDRWAPLEGPEDLERLDGPAILVGEAPDGVEGVDVPADAPWWEIAPWEPIAWAQENLDTLSAVAGLAGLRGRMSAAQRIVAALDALRQDEAPTSFRPEAEAARACKEAQEALRARIAGMRLEGEEILQALGGGPPPAVKQVVQDVLHEVREGFRDRIGIPWQPLVPTIPIQVDEEEVARMSRRLEGDRTATRHAAQTAAARIIQEHRATVADEVAEALRFDGRWALGRFALAHDLHPARFGEEVRFDASVHVELATDPDAQRIAYHVGGTTPVVLLTGANSGGKSTLLEHVALLVLMARMGLPVVGRDVTVPWVQELHLVTARRGMDAGAFETFLRRFLPLVRGDARRLVLVDEVEAVTELEAAGRILGFFVDRLAASGSLGVIVTHMAPQVLSHVHHPVRVDGIEAKGLDDENRLMVDRCPRMGHLARSTPELIVQRLAARSRGDDQALYAALLERFQGTVATTSTGKA